MLRPKVEVWPVMASFTAGAVAVVAPWAFMMTPPVAYGTAGCLFLFGSYRGIGLKNIWKYQRNLRCLPTLSLTAEEIPVSEHKLYLGKGFRWTQKHTQRLKESMNPSSRKYIEMPSSYLWARDKEVAWENKPVLKHVSKLLLSNSSLNPLRALPPIGGKPQLHSVELKEKNVLMSLHERVGHTLVLGTTRVGKTRLCEVLITQDIHRGDIVIVFDPKGDADLMKRVIGEARKAGRENELTIFHLGHPEISARYNGIGNFNRITEVASRTANQLAGEGSSTAFKEFGWRFTNIVAQALVALGRRPDYGQIAQHIQQIEVLLIDYYKHWLSKESDSGWEDEVAAIKGNINDRSLPMPMRGRNKLAIALVMYTNKYNLNDMVASGLKSAFEYDKTYFDKIVASLLPLLEKLITGDVSELVSPIYEDLDDERPIFDWKQVIRQKGVIYIGLDAMQDLDVASTIGNTMFADLVSEAGDLYKHGVEKGFPSAAEYEGKKPTISLHADEFNELIGDEFIPMINKAGGAGFQVTAYTQTISDIEARIGSESKAGQIIGNFNTLIMLRVKEKKTAEIFTDQLDLVELYTVMEVSGANDSADVDSQVDFTSKNEDRLSVVEAPLLAPADLMSLSKGQAFVLMDGGALWKIRIPLPEADNDESIPQDIRQIADQMKSNYATREQWWQAK